MSILEPNYPAQLKIGDFEDDEVWFDAFVPDLVVTIKSHGKTVAVHLQPTDVLALRDHLETNYGSKRMNPDDYCPVSNRPDLVICRKCSTRSTVVVIQIDEHRQHEREVHDQ